jgi:hypothetical protein
MRYLGIVRRQDGTLRVPDTFREAAGEQDFEAVEVGGDILLLSAPLDRERLKAVEALAERSVAEHRRSLEGLAR